MVSQYMELTLQKPRVYKMMLFVMSKLCTLRFYEMMLDSTILKLSYILMQDFFFLTLSQMTDFRLFQIERVCRQQFQT